MKTRKAKDIGELLVNSLTSDQLICFLNTVITGLDFKQRMNDLEKADPDMAASVQRIVERTSRQQLKSSKEIQSTVSDKKIMENWNSQWQSWDDIIAEIGDEEGEYSVQEAHWEPPYFNSYQVAEDLEPIAQNMLDLIDDVHGLVDNPDLFFEALEEISDSILSYPEWMGVEHDERLTLGKNATCCVLKWYWLSALKENNAGQSLLVWVHEMEEAFDLLELDDNECIDFFAHLPKHITKEIYLQLNKNRRQFGLDESYSIWHQINHLYEAVYDSVKYFETCEKHIDDSWTYGYPLVKDAVEKKDFESAETYLIKTFSSYLKGSFSFPNREENEVWCPESSLLLNRYYHYSESPEAIFDLMEIWAIVSEKLGNHERNRSARLQSVTLRNSEDWNSIIDEYKNNLNSGNFQAPERLFCEWKDRMAERSMELDGKENKSDSWVHWLIDAQIDKNNSQNKFHEKLINWLNRLNRDENRFKNQWRMLARLTKDLQNGLQLMEEYPAFVKNILPAEDTSALGKARMAGLAERGMGDYMSTITQTWKNQLHKILPDPSTSRNSDYAYHAAWMRALYELNPGEYRQVLNQWRTQHARKRNLWRDMSEIQLPL